MKHLKLIVVIVSAMFFADSHGISAELDSVTITFGEGSHDIGDMGPIDESGYRYEPIGASWQLIGPDVWDHGGVGNALFSFYGIHPAIGNVTTFRRLDESPFVFQSLELRGRFEGQRNSVVVAFGFLDGIEVASQALQSSSETWRMQIADSGFLKPIDKLRLEVVEINGSAVMFDNLVFTPVPEPKVYALLALGLSAFAWVRVCRVRK
jgi:hypothetical protein